MKAIEKVKFAGAVFMYGAKAQLKQGWTIGAAASIGLSQGFKYKGSVKQGVIGGVVTLGVIMAANGVYNVITYWDKINEI